MRLLAVVLVAAVLLACSLLQSGASAALRQSVDPEWNGAYDILVTAADPASTPGKVLAPNSLRGPGERMSLADVTKLRAIAGVELAAPIGEIALSSANVGSVSLVVPVDTASVTPAPQAYRATIRLITDDGLGERIVSESQLEIALDRSNAPRELLGESQEMSGCGIGDVPIDCAFFSYSAMERMPAWVRQSDRSMTGFGSFDGDAITVSLGGAPGGAQRVTLIDPVAESELLGNAGSFLDPLIELGNESSRSFTQLAQWAADIDTPEAEHIRASAKAQQAYEKEYLEGPAYQEYLRILSETGGTPEGLYEDTSRYIPMLLADESLEGTPFASQATSLRVEVEFEGFGAIAELPSPMSAIEPDFPEALSSGEPGTPIGIVSADASVLLTPHGTESVMIPWPGEQPPAETVDRFGSYLNGLRLENGVALDPASLNSRVIAADGQNRARLDAQGFRTASEGMSGYGVPIAMSHAAEGSTVGAEAAFDGVSANPFFSRGSLPESLVSVATFTAEQLEAVAEGTQGTPLGAYAAVSTELLRDAEGREMQGVSIAPSLSGFGLGANRTAAIADIAAAELWADSKIVDAVRVRAAGVERYDSAGISAVASLAESIEQAGYTATLVAGASAQTIELAIGGYAFGTMDAGGEQRVGELGVIEQQWTVLGPAASLGNGLMGSTLLLLATVLASVLGLYAAATVGGVAAKRREAGILNQIGWNRARILRWHLTENALLLLGVGVAGLIAMALAFDPSSTARVVQGAVLAVLLISVLAIMLALRQRSARAVSGQQLAQGEHMRRPEVRQLTNGAASESEHAAGEGPLREGQKAPASVRTLRRVPNTPSAVGVRRAWQSWRSSVVLAGGLGALMATVSAIVLSQGSGWFSPTSAPQLMLAACGLLAASGLIAIARHRAQLSCAGEDLVLREQGWRAADLRIMRRAELLATAVPALLLGAYVVSFSASALGIASSTSAVSVGLLAGVLATALLLFAPRLSSLPERLKLLR